MEQIDEIRKALSQLQEKLKAYNHAIALLYFDGATTAPRDTAENRAHTLGILSEEVYRLSTGEESVRLLEAAEALKNSLSEEEKRIVFLMLKDIRQMQKIPIDEYVRYQQLLAKADDAWHRAKEQSNFPLFEPYLEEIFETHIRFAGYCAPDRKPYDYWLNEYEDGLDMATCDEFFSALRERIAPLLYAISEKTQVDDSCLKGYFSDEAQQKLAMYLMKFMGLDMNHVGFGTTEHPFTTSLGCHLDERITTRFDQDNITTSMYSVIHEGGHALYDTGSPEEYAFTMLDGGVSMGVHESQSRFYENLLGRSKAFISAIMPKLWEFFPSFQNYTEEDVWRAVNKVTPSLIRTESDEVTYSLHIMIRYELEKRVMAGELKVHDLPDEWNRLYAEYLGVKVPDDKHGILQDSHWSGGSIGYFPSYALGNAYGAQLLMAMKESVDVEACLRRGDFGPINEWNREHIWKYGSLLKPGELLKMAFRCKQNPEGRFQPGIYLDYLESKYREVYDIK